METRRGCCGTGTVEATSLLCNTKSPGTCSNTRYVFWDSVHPSQAANQILADALIVLGFISTRLQIYVLHWHHKMYMAGKNDRVEDCWDGCKL